MKKETLDALKDHLDGDLRELLTTDPQKLQESMLNKTEDAYFQDGMHRHKNPRLPLFHALQQEYNTPSWQATRDVLSAAVKADEFHTAVNKYEQALKSGAASVNVVEYDYYRSMAELHGEKEPKEQLRMAIPYPSMMENASKISQDLKDPEYLRLSAEYRAQLAQATQKVFNNAESTLLSMTKKSGKRSGVSTILSLAVWGAGGWFILRTLGPVWRWAHTFFTDHLTPLMLFFWLVPILYAVILGIITLVTGSYIYDIPSKGPNDNLKNKIEELKTKAEHSVSTCEAARKLWKYDQHMPKEFRDYGSRLVLSATSVIYQENFMIKLCALADNEQTWLTRMYIPKATDQLPYASQINDLLYQDKPTPRNIFLAHTLKRKQQHLYDDPGTPEFTGVFVSHWDDHYENGQKMAEYVFKNYFDMLQKGMDQNTPMPQTALMLQTIHKATQPYFYHGQGIKVWAQYGHRINAMNRFHLGTAAIEV